MIAQRNYLFPHFLNRNRILICLFLSITSVIYAQKATDYHYNQIDTASLDELTAQKITQHNSIFSLLKANLGNKLEQQKLKNSQLQTISKLEIVKNQYSEYKDYPSTISDGWHSAIATDNINFCEDVKLLIKENHIIKCVVDGYIPINFIETREIKNAKSVISLKDFNGEEMNIVEVYFLYDIDKQNLIQEPLKPGYVCFWTDLKDYDKIQLKLDNLRLEHFTDRFDSEPNCFSNGMIYRMLKPGYHSYIALGKGTIDWKDSFEVKENMCLKIRLGRAHNNK